MFPPSLSRRTFLQRAALGTAALTVGDTLACAAESTKPGDFSFVLLGDLHFDRMEHHDMAWLEKNKGGDLSQIKNYCRITAELMPRLFATVKESVTALRGSGGPAPAFVLQVGDLVEGLCGTEELSVRQNREALAFVKEHDTGLPFLFTKGNHDVTGDGAPAAFAEIFHPFLTEQRRRLEPQAEALKSARYTVRCGPAQFYFFDAYDKESLDWLEAALVQQTAEHCFVVIHPPVVPYGARVNWIIFNQEKQVAQREKLLALLAKHRAIVLGGHIHRFNHAVRTVGKERFAQLAVSSVVNSAETKAKTVLEGLESYTPEQITVEPNFSPETAEKRRQICTSERPFMQEFAYADLPGHAVVKVEGGRVTAEVYSGICRELYRKVDLTEKLRA